MNLGNSGASFPLTPAFSVGEREARYRRDRPIISRRLNPAIIHSLTDPFIQQFTNPAV